MVEVCAATTTPRTTRRCRRRDTSAPAAGSSPRISTASARAGGGTTVARLPLGAGSMQATVAARHARRRHGLPRGPCRGTVARAARRALARVTVVVVVVVVRCPRVRAPPTAVMLRVVARLVLGRLTPRRGCCRMRKGCGGWPARRRWTQARSVPALRVAARTPVAVASALSSTRMRSACRRGQLATSGYTLP